MWSIAISLLLGSLLGVDAQDQCYYAAGKAALDQYVPCGTGSGISACCLAGDFCLEDGACYSPGTKMTYIAGCTDSTFGDGSCKGGSDTCNKQTQFQGLALCGNNWVCCQGQGQSGDIPSSDFSHDCPCDQGFGTAIANAASLPGTESLGTAFSSHAAPTSSSSAAATTSSGGSSSSSSSHHKTKSSAAASSFSTIPLTTTGGGITGTGSGSAAATSSGAGGSGGGSSGTPTGTKIGLGVGIPLGVAALAGVSVALFFARKRLVNREPKYVTQADLSTPVYVGETPGSGGPAPRNPNAGAAGASAAGGWNGHDQQMSEGGASASLLNNQSTNPNNGLNQRQSNGNWAPPRLQAMQ